MAVVMPPGKQAYTRSDGTPLVGGRLRTFAAGTSTPKPTYADAAGTVANTNPLVLDARGEATIYWSGAYKVQLEDAAGAVLWTIDNYVATDAIATDSRGILPSATTVDIGAQVARTIDITGSATIQSLGTTAQDGAWRFLRFIGSATLVHNEVSLILPGAENLVTAPGDTALAVCLGSGNWYVVGYQRALNPSASTNLLINANPVINQRGYVSGTATTVANQYTLDRWRVVVSGQSLSWSDADGVRTMTAPAGGLEQVIAADDIIGAAGKSYAISWVGTATASINGTSVIKGQSVTNIAGGVNVTIRFSGGTVSLPQFEVGTLATPFQSRPYGTELALCQRYYEAAAFYGSNYGTAGALIDDTIYFRVPKRATPTIAFSNAIYSNASGISAPVVDSQRYLIRYTSTAAGMATATADWTASAEL